MFDLRFQSNFNASADTVFVLNAGISHEVVTKAIAVAQIFGAATTAGNVDQRVDLGNGNDNANQIEADSRSKGASTINQEILGQAGNDTIIGTVYTSSSLSNTGGSSKVTQVIDGGTGNDSISVTINGRFEALDSITATIASSRTELAPSIIQTTSKAAPPTM